VYIWKCFGLSKQGKLVKLIDDDVHPKRRLKVHLEVDKTLENVVKSGIKVKSPGELNLLLTITSILLFPAGQQTAAGELSSLHLEQAVGRSRQLLQERRQAAAALPDSLRLHHRRAQVLLRFGQKEALGPLRRSRPGEAAAQPRQSQLPQRYATWGKKSVEFDDCSHYASVGSI